jgi:hypothetical protein
MSPDSTIRTTFRHCFRARSSPRSSRTVCSARFAFCLSFPWQLTQWLSTNATPTCAKGPAAGAAAIVCDAHAITPASAMAGREQRIKQGITGIKTGSF